MKLSTSSSIFFATLALSSSTSALAAPARDGGATESTMSVSPSNNDLFDSSVHPATGHCSAHSVQSHPPVEDKQSETIVARSNPTQEIMPILGSVPLVGPLLVSLLSTLLGGVAGLPPADLNPNDVAALRAAVAQLIQQFKSAGSPVQNAAGGVLPLGQNDVVPSSGFAAASSSSASVMPSASVTPSSAVVDDVPPSSSSSSSASAMPSPAFPQNPPNTPSTPLTSVMPVHPAL